ncbi:LysE family translocator [Pseudoalteromonas denitrificans]|uniref:Threonine/homoserine/homoserine lactone efflux protein n=1 Tax=Pseudoalteromonas denitrificans DSM 6059 TaxID=1123010 RepID=A0A1I1PDK4_9GAMM|nr:LysE family translocator [Pseudoalteromonas denitrificans]SFD07917.1 Threonine/homoserine/homoserine lactone efflux protein [Pseudoalteromonas denitrificans DSM 6059]
MSLFIVWLGVMFPLVFSPGPANIVFAASGAQVGVKRSIPLVAGIDSVFIIKSIIIGYGLGEVVNNHPELMNYLQLLGAIYLVYVATKFLRTNSSKLKSTSKALGFFDGLLIQILNSKGWLMVFLMFTLFSEQSQATFGDSGIAILIIWLAFLNISIHFLWVSIGELLSRISSSPLYEKWLNFFYAGCLMAVSIWLIIENPMIKTVLSTST